MSRSGNHAVINWILSQATGRTCFLNCTEPKFNPFLTARPLDDGRSIIAEYPGFDLEAELAGRFSEKDLLMHSHEDCFLGTLVRGAFEENHDAMVGPSRSRRDALILRDPYNLFASRRHGGFGEVSETVALRIWKQHAREFLGIRRYLKERPLLVNYNRWSTDPAYRQELAAQLGFELRDDNVHEVPAAGNGSSFDGRRYHGAASRMRTLERWKHFAGDPDYASLFDEEVHDLARKIFGGPGDAGRKLPEPEEIVAARAAAG